MNQAPRAMRLARMLPLESRRRRHLVKLVHKFYGNAHNTNATTRQIENWRIISTYGTVSPFVRHAGLPQDVAKLDRWKTMKLWEINAQVWSKEDSYVRKIPPGSRLPHVYRDNISTTNERKATQWYMCRIPGSPLLTKFKPILSNLLANNEMSDEEITKLDHILCDLNYQETQ